jgi:hypothetical protein
MSTEILKIVSIVTPSKVYIAKADVMGKGYWSSSGLSGLLFDGEKALDSFHDHWSYVQQIPKKVTKICSAGRDLIGYELRDKTLKSDKIPVFIEKADVSIDWDNDGEDYWTGKYASLEPLYFDKYVDRPEVEEDVPFEIETIMTLDVDLKNPGFDFQGFHTLRHSRSMQDNLKYQELDKILFPDIYVETMCPVKLSSGSLYKIIRSYINEHIDTSCSIVTSNYDFCYKVQKKILLPEPVTIKTEIRKCNGRSYATPRFKHSIKEHSKTVTVFEMTNKDDKYRGYSVLPDITAGNVEELSKKVDDILNILITEFNTPSQICSCCGGSGLTSDVQLIRLNDLLEGVL